MDSQRRLRSNRKPLSDCTNILTSNNRRVSKISKSKTLIKPINSNVNNTNTNTNNKEKQQQQQLNNNKNKNNNNNDNDVAQTTYSSPKSHTSTGSNNSPNSLSIPRSPDPPAPPTPLSDAGGIDGRKSWFSAYKNQRHEALTWKDKGKEKMVAEDPIFQLSAYLTSKSYPISSSVPPAHCSHSEDPSFQSQKLLAQAIKAAGKTIVDAPIIEPPAPLLSKNINPSSSFTFDGSLSETSAVHSQKSHVETRKDKGKEKMVAEDPIFQLSASLTSKSYPISSSVPPAHCSRSEDPSFQSQKLLAQAIKAAGKTIVDAPIIEPPAPFLSKYINPSSSFTSDGSLSETSAVHSQKLHVETRKDKGKMVLKTLNIEASDPSTPHVPPASFAASGTCDRPVTVYSLRRAGKGRKYAAGKINEPFTCPPDQRRKKKGLELDYGQSDKNAGSHTDPLPMHKKKRSSDKYSLPQDEVEKLRAYYADIDAFELPEEVASESELE